MNVQYCNGKAFRIFICDIQRTIFWRLCFRPTIVDWQKLCPKTITFKLIFLEKGWPLFYNLTGFLLVINMQWIWHQLIYLLWVTHLVLWKMKRKFWIYRKFKVSVNILALLSYYRVSFNNYRPILLLSIFDKIIEKAMHKRLYSFLDEENPPS